MYGIVILLCSDFEKISDLVRNEFGSVWFVKLGFGLDVVVIQLVKYIYCKNYSLTVLY